MLWICTHDSSVAFSQDLDDDDGECIQKIYFRLMQFYFWLDANIKVSGTHGSASIDFSLAT